jgi:hypothetical protein
VKEAGPQPGASSALRPTALLLTGFTFAGSLTASPGGLLPHLFTLTPTLRAVTFCGTFRRRGF